MFNCTQGSSSHLHQGAVETYEDLVQYCGRNSLSKSLLYMQRCLALQSGNANSAAPSGEQKKLLQVSDRLLFTLINY